MYSEAKISELKDEYNKLCNEERELEHRLNDVKLRKIEIQRDIAKNQPADYEERVLTQLYEQKQGFKKSK